MAHYTTEVRTVCEEITGQSCDFTDADEVIALAAPKIFRDYPIFSESHRAELNQKILRHYFFREIGLETVGLWKMMLNTRMREIMPYYNKLYESELLDFNPLYDVDTYTDSRKASSGSGTRSGSDNTRRAKAYADTGAETETGETGRKSVTSESSNIAERSADSSKSDTKFEDKSASSTGRAMSGSTSDTSADKEAGSNGRNANSRTAENGSTRSAASTGATDATIDKSASDTKTATSTGSTRDSTEAMNDSNWSLYSDTPQGSLGGALGQLTSDVTTGITADTNTYLTNATHNVDARTTDTGSGQNDASAVAEKSDTSRETDADRNTAEATASQSETAGTVATDENSAYASAKSHDGKSSRTESADEASALARHSTTDSSQSAASSRLNDSSLATASAENTADSKHKTAAKDASEAEAHAGEHVENTATSDAEAGNIHYYGKTPGKSYAELVMQWRDTFINIDMMIIEELQDLFMNVY